MARPKMTSIHPSPTLIDLTVYKPSQTLIDRQDEYGYPPPEYVDKPYRDCSSNSGRSECGVEEEIAKLLNVARVKRGQGKDLSLEPREVQEKGRDVTKEEGEGCFSVTLPDGSIISFRPPATSTTNSVTTSETRLGAPLLTRPVVARGYEEAFEAIKQLAIGNGNQLTTPKPLPSTEKKKLGPPPVPPKRSLPTTKLSKAPWSTPCPAPTSSKIIPTAPPFKPSRLRPSTRIVPPSPSSSPSPPLSNYTEPPPLSSSRTSSHGQTPPLSPPGDKEQAAILFTSPSQLESLFKSDIKSIPWTKVDFPYVQRPKKKTRKVDTENLVHISQTREEIEAKLDNILKSFEDTLASTPIVRQQPARNPKPLKKYNLDKWDGVAERHYPLSERQLNPIATSWNPSVDPFRPKTSSAKLVEFSPEPPISSKPSFIYHPDDNEAIDIYDPPSRAKIVLEDPKPYGIGDDMNAVEVLDWVGGSEDVQDVASYFDQRDEREKKATQQAKSTGRSGGGGRSSAWASGSSFQYPLITPLVDVSEFSETIKTARTREPLGALPINPYDRLLSQRSARATVPKSLCYSKDGLQFSLMRSWIAAEPTDDQKRYIANLSKTLTRVIDNEWGLGKGASEKRFTVDVFGSVSWGGETGRGGDVDMVIRDSFYPQGYHPALWEPEDPDQPVRRIRGQRPNVFRSDLSPVYDLHNVVYLLKKKGFSEVFGIYGATTPIAKFKDPTRPGMEVDVNVNDLGGWYNSRLILAYCEISPHVLRPLIHCLKLWSKANHVNDPSGKYGMPTMSSYCLTLMAIAYLQHCGVLPNLQEDVEVRIPDYPETDAKDTIWAGWGKPTGTKINVEFKDRPDPEWESGNPGMTAAEAVRGFFAFFSRTSSGSAFQYNTQVVSILNGGIMERAKSQGQENQEVQARKAAGIPAPTREEMNARETMMGKGDQGVQPRNWSERKLVVQDAFIWQKNCTQSMSRQGLERWTNAVDRAHQILAGHKDKCDLDVLLSKCLKPPTDTSPYTRGGQGMDRATRDQMYRPGGGGHGGRQGGQGGGPGGRWQEEPPRASPYGRYHKGF